ncbi:prefoldin subunit alpha [Methanomassiliicoccus luminyensis]|jgi:prefoldin alpha subunit|uniref:prefoldin subunit alpha n=1 Tax=Methanomassiliicoccus luminyensis TaxID=1080712 RepID=UPI0003725F6E|nr:prefoldin subunit alpha [Methanomassiliicoccus luminyensis]
MNEAELRQAMSALELYRTQLESIAQNQQLVQMSLEELARAKETLTRYKDAPEGSELLVPIGGNSFIFAKVATNSKAIVGLGTGVSVEKSMDEAVKTMESRANELVDTMKKLDERRIALEQQADQLSMAVQQEMQAMQQLG